mmetsp:Transcript_104689/g.223796  ORF Transcript_104689/g.223796 Transcript_104689/m.223796 type:complete len:221 (+) Transcript_104689:117-779(+)
MVKRSRMEVLSLALLGRSFLPLFPSKSSTEKSLSSTSAAEAGRCSASRLRHCAMSRHSRTGIPSYVGSAGPEAAPGNLGKGEHSVSPCREMVGEASSEPVWNEDRRAREGAECGDSFPDKGDVGSETPGEQPGEPLCSEPFSSWRTAASACAVASLQNPRASSSHSSTLSVNSRVCMLCKEALGQGSSTLSTKYVMQPNANKSDLTVYLHVLKTSGAKYP